jgi:subfamily B ATP-binding cassette protein MsbA
MRIGTAKNLLYLVKQQRKSLFIFVVIITITSSLEAVGIGMLYPILNILESEAKKAEYTNYINDLLPFSLEQSKLILAMFIIVFILFLLRGFFIILSSYSQFRLSQGLMSKWQSDIFTNYMNQDYDYFVRHKAGDLLQKQMVHTENTGNAVVYSCQIIMNLVTAIFLFVMLCLLSLKGALFLTPVLIIVAIISFIVSKLKIYKASKEHAQLQQESYSIATEVIIGIRQIKAFLAEEFFRKRFSKKVRRKAQIYVRNATIGHTPAPILQTLVLLVLVSVLLFISYQEQDTGSLLALIAVFGTAAYRIISSTASVNTGFMQLAHLLPSINIVSNLLSLKNPRGNYPKIEVFKDSIRFKDVYFSYSRKGFNLYDINLSFNKGKFYGIVGPSGSGKSTLVDLLIGFYKHSKGEILIDGRDLKEIDIHSWRKLIGLISQETFIFNDTVEKNISFAVEETDVVMDRVVAAAKAADIHDFINDLPEKYETVVGERGLKLSGGQRQRLAIARAVYRNPEIYIFDEATSSLDTYSERKIQKSIEDLSKSKTVIAVAHRLSTIINADLIIAMDNGRVVEIGDHDKLMTKKGFYARLYEHQHNKKDILES